VKRKDTQVVTELVPTWQRLGEGVEPQLINFAEHNR
jgi:hypothetical protein